MLPACCFLRRSGHLPGNSRRKIREAEVSGDFSPRGSITKPRGETAEWVTW